MSTGVSYPTRIARARRVSRGPYLASPNRLEWEIDSDTTGSDQGAREGPDRSTVRQRAEADGRVLARLQLPLGRNDLPQGQSVGASTAGSRGCETPFAGPLGREPGAVVRVAASESAHQQARSRRDLRGWTGPRRAGRARPGVPRGHVLGGLPRQE